MHSRSQARIFAFQFLYHLHYSGVELAFEKFEDADYLKQYLNEKIYDFQDTKNSHDSHLQHADSNGITAKTFKFALLLTSGVLANHAALKSLISKYSKRWTFEKMAKVDTTILLVSTYEMIFYTKTPTKVVIDEAINMAKKFSDKSGYVFINGVLDGIAKGEGLTNKGLDQNQKKVDK